MTTLEAGFTRLKAPPGALCIGLPQPDGTTSQVRTGEDGFVDVPQVVAPELMQQGYVLVASPQMADSELDELRAQRDELTSRLRDLEAEEASVTTESADASARLEIVKARLASADASLSEVRKAERAVEEARSRTVLIAEAVAVVLAELSGLARQVNAEELVRDLNRQQAESAPLIEAAADEAEAFVEAVVAARNALVSRAEIVGKLTQDFPRVRVPALTLAELGAALQTALSDSAVERQATALSVFSRLAEVLIVGPVYGLQSAEARARLAAVKVER